MLNNIEVVFATPESQQMIALTVPSGTTLLQAIELSGLLKTYPDITLNKVGVFGQLKDLNDVVGEGDRIEIYRPLQKDPMSARKDRAVTIKRKKFKPLRAKDLV
jgi:putative ubiquitin-RnfH superfamily antitoxin RatB of RatAB toxin-antitoxin module